MIFRTGAAWLPTVFFCLALTVVNYVIENELPQAFNVEPDKVYLENPNLLYALANDSVQIGTVRETFAVNQLSAGHRVEYGKEHGELRVDGTWTFEVGGEKKGFKQIADIPNSFILADGIEMPYENKLPLWIIGFMY